MKDFEVKTKLSEGQFKAMKEVAENKGLSNAEYLRNLILMDVYKSQNWLSRIKSILKKYGG